LVLFLCFEIISNLNDLFLVNYPATLFIFEAAGLQ